jgi:DNA-binding MarR family transcriptional regulator
MEQSRQGMGMTFAQYRALEYLGDGNPMHIAWLGQQLHISRQAAQRIVHKLERQDLVRTVDEGHETTIHLTSKGRRRIDLCRRATAPVHQGFERDLDAPQKANLIALLGRAELAFTPPPPRVKPWWLE